VVRAVGGRREDYQPVESHLTGCVDPITVAASLLHAAGATELYVADLDAIAGKAPVSSAVGQLIDVCRRPIWVDVGLGPFKRPSVLPVDEHVRPVVGSETCLSPDTLRQALAETGERQLAFSIDLKHGRLLGNWRDRDLEGDGDVLTLTRQVVELGVRTLIVLDLARVGTGTGSGTEPLLRAIRAEFPGVELIAGGGVKTWADVERLGEAGADAVLVASALHDGTLKVPRPS
jgi:phosphoribosylformimino-5-aminoimidazole carboxamide ribotide isomerase